MDTKTLKPLSPEQLSAPGLQSLATTKIRRRPGVATPDPSPCALRARAKTWLLAHLTSVGGSAETTAIVNEAIRVGIRPSTLYRARVDAGVHSESIPGSFPRRTAWSLAAPDGTSGRSRIAAAEAWLAGYLIERGGRAQLARIGQDAQAVGICTRMLHRARPRAGIRVEIVPGSFPRRTEWVLDFT